MIAEFKTLTEEQKSKLLKKLAKLKALAECKTGNANEVATAAAAMSRLMLEYQIEEFSLRGGQEAESEPTKAEDFKLFEKPFANWEGVLFQAICEVHECKAYQVQSAFGRKMKTFHAIGVKADVDNVRSLFYYLAGEIHRLAEVFAKGKTGWTKLKNDFKYGAAMGAIKSLKESKERIMQEQKAAQSFGLVLFDKKRKAIQTYQEETKLRLRNKTVQQRAKSASAYHAGFTAGQGLNRAQIGAGQKSLPA